MDTGCLTENDSNWIKSLDAPCTVQSSAKRRSPGLVNFVTAVAHNFCLALHAAFTQPGNHLLAGPCNSSLSRPDLGLGLELAAEGADLARCRVGLLLLLDDCGGDDRSWDRGGCGVGWGGCG